MHKMRTGLALLNVSLSGLTLLTAGGCSTQAPSPSSSTTQIRKLPPQPDEQRIAAFTAAKPYATTGVVNAVIPERHILQVQGIEPQRVALGQVITVVADNDLENPIYATVFDRQQGFLQLRYEEDRGQSRKPRLGDIAFCYLPKPALPQSVEAPKQTTVASRFSPGITTYRSLVSMPSERSDTAAEAPLRPAPKPGDRLAVSKQPEELKPSVSAIQMIRKLLALFAPLSRPADPPRPTGAAATKRPNEQIIEFQSAPPQLAADSHLATPSDDRTAPERDADPSPLPPDNRAEDLRPLLGVQLSGHRRVELPKLPPITIQGFVRANGGEPMALLEIGDTHRAYLVQKGSEISINVPGDVTPQGKNELTGLPGPKGSETTADAPPKDTRETSVILKVVQITNEGVILETDLAQTLTVR